MNELLQEKYTKLKNEIASYGCVAVAFSSGVDSTLLLYAAKEALGEKAFALTGQSSFFPKRELTESKDFCDKLGISHHILSVDEVEIEGFAENPPNRCYICKKNLFTRFLDLAHSLGANELLEGSNVDDDSDYRPGAQAIRELGVKSPLKAAGLTKEEIRQLSKEFDLPTWSKPSFACLASRFPYGESITAKKLKMVEEAEDYLMDLGFPQFRVRIHNNLARIEVLPEDLNKLLEEKLRLSIDKKLKEIGFDYVSLDLKGFRSGSMNEVLAKQ